MPRREAERIADALLRMLRPHAVAALDAALAMPEPESAGVPDEASYIAERVAAQLARYRAKSAGARRPEPEPSQAQASLRPSRAHAAVRK